MIMGQFSDKEMKKNTNRGAMLSAMRYALVVGGYTPTTRGKGVAGRGRCKYLILRFSQGSKVDIARIRYLEVWQFQGCC